MTETLDKVHIEGTNVNIIKAIYKPTANTLNGEKLEAFPVRSETKTRTPTLATFIQHSTRSPIQSSQARKRKGTQVGKKELKLSLIAEDNVYRKAKDFKYVRANQRIKWKDTKSIYQNLLYF